MGKETNRHIRAVVIGGAGFIGSHLCEALTESGASVTCVDNFETGRLTNLRALVERPGFRLLRQDMLDGIEIAGPVDVVYHLTAPATPSDYLLDPVRATRAASVGTLNALELAHHHHARFVLLSTSETYGPPTPEPLDEAHPGAIDPVAAYGAYYEARRFAEAATSTYRAAYSLSTAIARIFNTYGPRMRLDDGRVLARLIRQVLTDGAVTIPGSGAQRRSLCYVDDTVAGVLALANSAHPGPMNVGNPDDVSIFSLAQQLIDLTDGHSPAAFVEAPPNLGHSRRPDITLAGEVLGWRPRVPVKEGLATTIAWFRENGSAHGWR
ncbi:NAD-dependent epimerase/dehydratase family protein [Haloactinopolyspora sp.]|uniref:NAD-dependent epimerase/dehydratase family protein n=1 Tax=Haloactinopolyspora sp. TaxID=1966353 RepID=UPI00262B8F69|nr:NAD-dependent epimerase/dehydratase family protein [Haloactinopolyspora sp.]